MIILKARDFGTEISILTEIEEFSEVEKVIIIAQVRVNGSYKFQIEKVKIKGFAPTPCISLSSGA